jgi:patj-like protein
LQEGDQILAIDGHVFNTFIPHEEAIDILQKAHGVIDIFVARRTVPDEKSDLKSIKAKKSDLVVIETEGEEDKSSNQDMVLNTEWAQVEMVEIVNDGTGLGFGIIGGRSSGVVVKTIVPGGVSDLVNSLLFCFSSSFYDSYKIYNYWHFCNK